MNTQSLTTHYAKAEILKLLMLLGMRQLSCSLNLRKINNILLKYLANYHKSLAAISDLTSRILRQP
jgi:hypothetical protein